MTPSAAHPPVCSSIFTLLLDARHVGVAAPAVKRSCIITTTYFNLVLLKYSTVLGNKAALSAGNKTVGS